jgi:hypothetical protein
MSVYKAIDDRNLSKLQEILKNGVNLDDRELMSLDSPVFRAIILQDELIVKILLEYGFSPNFGGWTSNLNAACSIGNLAIVELSSHAKLITYFSPKPMITLSRYSLRFFKLL